jgi:hypothetical protein
VVPVPADVHPEVDVVTPEKYIIPSAVFIIGSPFNNVDGKGLFIISELFKTCVVCLIAIFFFFINIIYF